MVEPDQMAASRSGQGRQGVVPHSRLQHRVPGTNVEKYPRKGAQEMHGGVEETQDRLTRLF